MARSKVTIRDVAAKAGVAISSVSRALSSGSSVSPNTRARVLAAAEELGYTPDRNAQGLRSGLTRTVGFVVRSTANPQVGELVEGAERILSEAGYGLLLTNSGGLLSREVERLGMLASQKIDGLLITTVSDRAIKMRNAVKALDRPIVFVDREVGSLNASSVLIDHRRGMREAVDHLFQLGHRRIAYLTEYTNNWPNRENMMGFAEAHSAASVSLRDDYLVSFAGSLQEAKRQATSLIKLPSKERPTAWVIGGSGAMLGALEALSDHNVRLGEDVSLVATDDSAWFRVFEPTVSSISYNAVELGEIAAELLLDMARGMEPRRVVLSSHFEIRESSRRRP